MSLRGQPSSDHRQYEAELDVDPIARTEIGANSESQNPYPFRSDAEHCGELDVLMNHAATVGVEGVAPAPAS